jgi:hypothetical protein
MREKRSGKRALNGIGAISPTPPSLSFPFPVSRELNKKQKTKK